MPVINAAFVISNVPFGGDAGSEMRHSFVAPLFDAFSDSKTFSICFLNDPRSSPEAPQDKI